MNRSLGLSCGRSEPQRALARRPSIAGCAPAVPVRALSHPIKSFQRLQWRRSGPVSARASGERSSSVPPPPGGPVPPGLPRSPSDDGSTQITLLLSMSVSLLLLPWVARHPSFLIGLPLLAVTPVVGQGVRPILREALTSVLKGLRLGGALLPHPHDENAADSGHHAAAAHPHAHPQQQPHGGYLPASPRARKDPRTVPHGPSASAAVGHFDAVEPSGPYSEWRPPAERGRVSSNSSFGSATGSSSPTASRSGGSPTASRDAGAGGMRWQQPQGTQQQHSHGRPSSASRDNLESLEEEEEALWAAAAASLQQRTGGTGSPGGSPNGSFSGGTLAQAAAGAAAWQDADAAAGSALGGSPWQARDPRVLSRDEKLQRLARQQSMQQQQQQQQHQQS